MSKSSDSKKLRSNKSHDDAPGKRFVNLTFSQWRTDTAPHKIIPPKAHQDFEVESRE